MSKPSSPENLEDAYKTEIRSQWMRFGGISAWVGVFLVLVFNILDHVVYPNHADLFLLLRFGCAIFIGLLAIVAATIGRKHIRLLTIGWYSSVQIMICYMIYLVGGVESSYYAGLNLGIIGIGLILPAQLRETIFYCLFTYLCYGIACFWDRPATMDQNFIGNSFFLLSTSLISCFSTYFLGKRRYQEFLLSFKLAERNKELDELGRLKSEFFANISHELRTPLTLILAPIQELLDNNKQFPNSLTERLAIVRDNALRLLKLVNDLLDVIRLEEGKARFRQHPVELNSMLRGVTNSMKHLAETKSISLSHRLSKSRLTIKGDMQALEKVFVNLLGNAIKFTDHGGKISLESELQDDGVWIRVRDTGVGISSEDLPNIFHRFHQADGSTTRRYQGTGLGLALVKEIVEHHGGSVHAASEPGRGTTITVRIPSATDVLDSTQDDDIALHDNLSEMHRQADRRGGLTIDKPAIDHCTVETQKNDDRPTVLVVDDEPDMRRYLQSVLAQDYQVLQARDGQDGLDKTLECQPDLVLLDLMLPKIDGLEVCRILKQQKKASRIKIMLLTARVNEQAKITALNHGADDFLTKPFSSLEVRTRLKNLLATAQLERDLADRNKELENTLSELQVTQGQLIQSEKINALGSLAAGLLHEINNPLNYTLTALQLVRADPSVKSNELLQEVVGDIDEGMQRIRAIVSDLRAFAYPSEADKQQIFDISQAVESALRFVASETKGIDIVVDLPSDESATVVGSQSHIVHVLVNLLSNAAKAVGDDDKAGGEIRIRGRREQGRLQLEVSDNGVGIPEENLSKIFDPFFTTRDVGEGMGLGLSICHTIVTNHGGALRADSRLGSGTRMFFDLPISGDQP